MLENTKIPLQIPTSSMSNNPTNASNAVPSLSRDEIKLQLKKQKEKFNLDVLELKDSFNEQVKRIAMEHSGWGLHHSEEQIRSTILYQMAQPSKRRQPTLDNAWAHAKAEARRLHGMCLWSETPMA